MNRIFAGLIIVFFCLLMLFYFILAKFIVNPIDGENNKSKSILIGHNIYLDTKNKVLFKMINTELNEIIIENKIDSISWNNDIILGFTDNKYFIITFNSNGNVDVKYYLSKNDIDEKYLYKEIYKKYSYLPSIPGLQINNIIK